MNWYNPLKKKSKKLNIFLIIVPLIVFLFAVLLFLAIKNANGFISDITSDESMPNNSMDFFDQYYKDIDVDVSNINISYYDNPISFNLILDSNNKNELSLSELYNQCSQCIVGIKGFTENKVEYNSWGTGVILSSDGLILTNTHVIEDCNKVKVVLFEDSEYEASLVGADKISDIAVLHIDCTNLKSAVFGDSSDLCVGQNVAAIGNPLGDEFSLTLTDGIISAIERGINYNGHSMTLIQTNTAINEGNSGGALFNMYGQVVGITNMKMMSSFRSIEGIGFAIPSVTCKKIIDELVENGEVSGRASVGMVVGMIPTEAKEQYNLPDGLYVTDVVKNSDAYKKGIKPGDVITAADGQLCTTTEEINTIKDKYSAGETITFTVYRDGKIFDVEVVLMDTNEIYG